ncbi:MAG TPA: UDPGP type 1 family protein [Humisphaera sp.]|jgi:UDP-N-acetylglucosamine/UDP-N-acetylgalactosamine diphosphorylase|nr:UDPGP type 1 family protein [Humisphaera sp.]
MDKSALQSKLKSAGQEQVLRFYDQLDAAGRAKLEKQLASQHLDTLKQLAKEYVTHKPQIPLPKEIRPVKAYPRVPDAKQRALYDQAQQRGRELLKAGKIAAFLVAGGQGTRLGYDGPKGEFPITPIKNKPLFQVFAEQLRAYSRDFGKTIPWYIMTSDVNDAATRDFFKKHNFFGCNPADVFFFEQGMMPAFAMDGKLLLAEKDSLALSPDGHGGSLRALERSGAVADMRKRAVEHLSYFQVDNPLVHCIDPLFLGLHEITGSEMSSKTIPKAGPLEKVGNFVLGDGILQVIEYSDLPDELAKQTNPDGTLRFNAGSIAIHALRVSFIERLNAGGQLQLPWHRAEKKVPYVDDKGQPVKPDKPNAIKLEQFVFDAIPLAKNAIVYETDRAEEFSPVKNAQGDDSPATCKRDQIRRAARWLREAGVNIPDKDGEPNAVLEISPLYATTAQQVKERNVKDRLPIVAAGASVYLE